MIGELHITLPWPPSFNSYWRPHIIGYRNPTVVMTTTQRARLYRTDVHEVIRAKLGHLRIAVFTCRVRMDLELRAPDRRKRDLDNHIKAIQDSLTHAKVLEDDSLIDELVVRRGLLIKDGCANLIISPLGSAQDPQPAQQRLEDEDHGENKAANG